MKTSTFILSSLFDVDMVSVFAFSAPLPCVSCKAFHDYRYSKCIHSQEMRIFCLLMMFLKAFSFLFLKAN